MTGQKIFQIPTIYKKLLCMKKPWTNFIIFHIHLWSFVIGPSSENNMSSLTNLVGSITPFLSFYFISFLETCFQRITKFSNTSFAYVGAYHMKYIFIPMNILQRTISYIVSYYHIIYKPWRTTSCCSYEFWVKTLKYGVC